MDTQSIGLPVGHTHLKNYETTFDVVNYKL